MSSQLEKQQETGESTFSTPLDVPGADDILKEVEGNQATTWEHLDNEVFIVLMPFIKKSVSKSKSLCIVFGERKGNIFFSHTRSWQNTSV